MTEMRIAGQKCLILGNDRPQCILVWFVNADAQKEVEFVARHLMAERSLPQSMESSFHGWLRDVPGHAYNGVRPRHIEQEFPCRLFPLPPFTPPHFPG